MQVAYILNIKDIEKNYERILKFLPLTAVQKASEFKEKDDNLRVIGGALLVEAFTAKSPLFYNEYGKPYKHKPPYFNVSHSQDKVGIYISDIAEVGLDIQHKKTFNAKLSDYVFNEEEKKDVNNEKDFALRWSMKEAAAKCVGTGLYNLKKQTIGDITVNTFVFCNEKLYYKNYVDGDYAVSLCSYKQVSAKLLNTEVELVLKMLAKKGENSI